MKTPKTPDGIETEAIRRSVWNGKSLRKNTFWILNELRRQKKSKKISKKLIDKQK